MIRNCFRTFNGAATLTTKRFSSKTTTSPTQPLIDTMTKIVCTLGPSTDQPQPINELVTHGMHVARLNFSHSGTDYSYPESCMSLVRNAPHGRHAELFSGSKGSNLPNNLRAILVDTKGPEIRTGVLQGKVDICEFSMGAAVDITTEDVSLDAAPESPDGPHRLNVDYQSIVQTVEIGGKILLDDGLIELEVISKNFDTHTVSCTALNGGPIKKNKGVNLPGVLLDLPALTDKDKRDLKWACEVGADYVAASFIRTPMNVRSVVAYLDRCISELSECNGQTRLRPLVISKIESKEGVDNFKSILNESDGIMVARGDLGVEIPYKKVFAAQKEMVSACNACGKPVIVATQMLDSMMRNPRPTRAEVTDVGTAVLDGADAVMLSGETAAGKYPIESLKAMKSVVVEADYIVDTKVKRGERVFDEQRRLKMTSLEEEMDAVASSAVQSASDLNAKLIVLITMSGTVARVVASHKPTVPVLAFCTDIQVARRLQLHRSITPIMLQSTLDPKSKETKMGLLRAEAIRVAKELGYLSGGDRYITIDRTAGKDHDMHDFSHNMKVSSLAKM